MSTTAKTSKPASKSARPAKPAASSANPGVDKRSGDLHWTRRPENRDKVREMAGRPRLAGGLKETLSRLALRGAHAELADLQKRVRELQVFIAAQEATPPPPPSTTNGD